jgi:DNA adenine methylase
VRWAGGKRSQLLGLLPHFPPVIDRYYEPFVGGAAVFWALRSSMRFRSATIGDVNPELMHFYSTVRDHIDEFIVEVQKLAPRVGDSSFYYEVRSWRPDELDPIARAARFLFLNKTCFNGVYRVNRKGQFNVPYGKVQAVFDYAAIHNAALVLRETKLVLGDYQTVVGNPPSGSVIYCDPPYWPSRPAGFTAYDQTVFGPDQHVELAAWARLQASRGCTVLLSNHDLPDVRALYSDASIVCTSEKRSVSCTKEGRAPVASVLIILSSSSWRVPSATVSQSVDSQAVQDPGRDLDPGGPV